MEEVKLSKRELAVLSFLQDCENGITVVDCQKLFHTTELRKIVSDLRKAGVPITDTYEKYKDSNGINHRYKRYKLSGSDI